MNEHAEKDLVVGCLAECEVALFNVIQHVDGLPLDTLDHVMGAFHGLKAYRESRFNANSCPKCHSPISSHPGEVECDRVPGVYS